MRRNGFGWNGCLLGIILVCVVLAICTEDAQAIPTFARKYRTSCATCHEAYPRLNGVGEAFRLNGYKFADDELYIKEEPVELGDDAYKRLWPNAIWPGDMPGMPPISITLENDYTYDIGGTEKARSEFKTPRIAKILGAGAFGEDISAFVELSFERQGAGSAGHHGGTSTAEGTDTDVAGWIQFEDLFGKENWYNFRVGTIGMHEIGLFTHRGHNRFSITNYFYGIKTPGLGAHNLKNAIAGIDEHDGIFSGSQFNLHAQPGIELNGFNKRWRYALGVTNGNGNKYNDNNTEKDVYFQLAHKIGGIGFDGSGMSESDDLEPASDPWRDDSLTLSLFGYYGTATIEIGAAQETLATADDYSSKEPDKFWRVGPGILWRKGNLQLGGGYIWGKNENMFGAVAAGRQAVNSKSWFVEANYFAKPWLIPYVRYETIKFSNLPNEVTSIDDASLPNGADRSRIVVGTKMLLRANITLGLEGIFYAKDDRQTSHDDKSQFIASLRMAF